MKKISTLFILIALAACNKTAVLTDGRHIKCRLKYTEYGAVALDSTNNEIPSYWIEKIIK